MAVTQEQLPHQQRLSAAARLRAALAEKSKTIICPGIYDGITARLALNEGFEYLYMTGAGTAATRLGLPDLGMTTMNDMVANAGSIASLDRSVPLIADADTGYGGPLMVARTVQAYMTAGVAAMHLEDQVVTKRCGHLANKELVDEDVYLSRIRAAVMAREELATAWPGMDIVIIARTDSLQSLGYDVAVSRLKKAISLGADVAFLEGMTSMEQCRSVCTDLAPAPVLLNMVAGGVTPDLSADEAASLGFRIIIFPAVCLGPVVNVVGQALKTFKTTRRNDVSEFQKQTGVKGFFNVCRLNEYLEFDRQAGGNAFNGGV
ncbi:Pyruvate/Phosphoenolpyruvate kinase-like domain-containing protein [Talaromyces proteolyticus]|uniref:Pyruvate/Phosphoenolpyruvate kinase-like domain-containing protein n=1 Tax=Talaromyces proteolyticus TaxID=1131652 RepID=A0AAD4PX98_9EURO|nr:Pyruvate/Phosphoenolpyruvate kinase-like domain-containing protein [Talaromyces proteolyticus]KAH8699102.1 Pyruvate/Phosphoenolpyruvate kinase-like domain-containing protein [Talaromyces proteolyticus]